MTCNSTGSGLDPNAARKMERPPASPDGSDLLLFRNGAVRRVKGHRLPISALELSPDGRLAITGSRDTTIRVWDLENGEERHCLRGHSLEVAHLAVSSDGRRLASASIDRTVRLWDLERGEKLRLLQHPLPVLRAYFVPDGTKIVTGTPVDGVRIWDSETGALLQFHRTWELPYGVSPCGKRVLMESGYVDLDEEKWRPYR